MKHGFPNTNRLSLGSLTQWKYITLLQFLVFQNLYWTCGMPFMTCMEIKIILSGFYRFITRLPIFIKMESLKILWNELEMYCLYTIVAAILQKRTEDRIFQLLVGLSPDFENPQSHILMNLELPSLK